jgi:hypothetical protein
MIYKTEDVIAAHQFTRFLMTNQCLNKEEREHLSQVYDISMPYLDAVIIPKNLAMYELWKERMHYNMVIYQPVFIEIEL